VQILVVDAANVVGSRPDGWWRDRAGAAGRLRDRLAAADLHYEVVLVVEGRARQGAPEGTEAGVSVRHAAGSGDDTIVDTVREHVDAGDEVVVVTADRELRRRVETAGAGTRGPSWLLDRL
jgi:hypothetical protein